MLLVVAAAAAAASPISSTCCRLLLLVVAARWNPISYVDSAAVFHRTLAQSRSVLQIVQSLAQNPKLAS